VWTTIVTATNEPTREPTKQPTFEPTGKVSCSFCLCCMLNVSCYAIKFLIHFLLRFRVSYSCGEGTDITLNALLLRLLLL
jgi:hypothetical protein